MKFRLMFLLALFCGNSTFAGNILYKNMYAQVDQVQGVGLTVALAQKDAESAIPYGFVKDPGNSPEIQCLLAEAIETEHCAAPGDQVVMTIPIIKSSN